MTNYKNKLLLFMGNIRDYYKIKWEYGNICK